ncbi:uncharacterized protein GIQ15_06877 [Arthroderma uncinatum]|uniref:uncharacterized protein n=1 Tax=Arthroderma uncinatum TaxID=74035 RepID=UPI00144AC4A2|nr:uncharacterized protein GIQ15_06877 [Arthroderma uncinatum]KAF3479901.1 hypothetical protein GIQ15_06877 [Arthroderma uncinatum]
MVSFPIRIPPDRPIEGGQEQRPFPRRAPYFELPDREPSPEIPPLTQRGVGSVRSIQVGQQRMRIATWYTPPPPWKPDVRHENRVEERDEEDRKKCSVWGAVRAFMAKLLAF